MSEIVNLRRVRKAKSRADAANEAAANRTRHGRTRGERLKEAMHVEQACRLLDGARRVSQEVDETAGDGD